MEGAARYLGPPLTRERIERWRSWAKRHPGPRSNVFSKVGDSITVSGDSLACLGSAKQPSHRHEPLEATREFFADGDAGGLDPYRRLSLSAAVGWSAWQATHGARSPLARELTAVRPRFALVQFGTNDIEMRAPHHFAEALLAVVDLALARGTLPILFTIPPRRDRADAARSALEYDAIVLGIARLRDVPFVRYHEALLELPRAGLSADGVHPSTFQGATGRDPCDFGAEGLRHGYNLRNLLALRALDRALALLGEGPHQADPPPDEPEESRAGAGTLEDPYRFATLPGVDAVSLPPPPSTSTPWTCREPAPGGGTLVWQVDLPAPAELSVLGVDVDGAVADLVLLDEDGGCAAWAPRRIQRRVGPGRWRIVVASREAEARGAVALVVLAR